MAKKIRVNIFEDMREALQHAAAYERGEGVNLRVTRIPARPKPISPKEVRHIRQALNASQALFATFLNVSPNAVRSWEQGTKNPKRFWWRDERLGAAQRRSLGLDDRDDKAWESWLECGVPDVQRVAPSWIGSQCLRTGLNFGAPLALESA
jgi:putative transcriptional regulator